MSAMRILDLVAVAGLCVASAWAQGGDARLVAAAQARDLDALIQLLDAGVEVDSQDAETATALHWAAHWDDLETAALLLSAGANPNLANRYGITPLHEAATVANTAMIRALLDAGADPNGAYGAGETAVMTAARTGNADALRLMLEHGGDPNASEEWLGQTALMFAAVENHPEVAQLLIENGANVNVRSTTANFGELPPTPGNATTPRHEGGLTNLHFAARNGSLEVGALLIDAGADLSATEPQWGLTPLQTAVMNAHYDFAALLVESGADVNDGSLYVAVEVRNLPFFANRPPPPDRDRDLTSMDFVRLLLDRGADPDRVFDQQFPERGVSGGIGVTPGARPLYRAAQGEDFEAMRILLDHGANASARVADGSTPLMLLSGLGARAPADNPDRIEAIKYLLNSGASVNARQPQNNNTAMHYAARAGRTLELELLLAMGGDLSAENRDGDTPLGLSIARAVQLAP